jgi:MFS-type transporter involved in bile tolerance (Atg22 family)
VAFSMPLGVYSGWGAVLAINLQQFGISAIDVGRFGCGMTLSGCFGGVIVGALADRFRGQMKGAILVCYALATAGFAAFALIATTTPSLSNTSGSGTLVQDGTSNLRRTTFVYPS